MSMEIINIITPKISFLWEVGLPFVIALTILVFVHEMGHYSVARLCNVKVEVFSIGFGPEIIGWNDKAGTRWKICIIPLGGYVKMFGEGDEAVEDTGQNQNGQKISDDDKAVSFQYKSLFQRSAIEELARCCTFQSILGSTFAFEISIATFNIRACGEVPILIQ